MPSIGSMGSTGRLSADCLADKARFCLGDVSIQSRIAILPVIDRSRFGSQSRLHSLDQGTISMERPAKSLRACALGRQARHLKSRCCSR